MNVSKLRVLWVLAMVLSVQTAAADIGPKPSMSFRLKYRTSAPVQLLGGEQMQSDDPSFTKSHPLAQVGPQRFHAFQDSCGSRAYGYAPYQKLVLKFSDRVRESNVFPSLRGDFAYEVAVTDTALVVGSPMLTEMQVRQFLKALGVTLAVELVLAIVFIAVARLPWVILLSVIVANVISVPFIWLVLPRLRPMFDPGFLAMEMLVIAFEAAFVFAPNRPKLFFRHALLLAILMNVASVVAGVLVGM